MGIFDELLKARYAGELYLKYDFTVDEIPAECMLLAEDTNTVWVEINGERGVVRRQNKRGEGQG